MKNNKLIRYIFFAIISSSLNVSVYYIFYTYILKSVLLANVIAYTISICFQFITNKKMVYKSKSTKYIQEFFKFSIVKMVAFLIDTSLLYILVNSLYVNNFIAKIISNCSTTMSNYTLNKKIVFKEQNN